MEGRREVSIISQRPVTSSDLKQERSFFRQSVPTFSNWLKLVVDANARHRTVNKPKYKLYKTFTRLVEQCQFNLGGQNKFQTNKVKKFFLSYDDNPK